MSTQLKPYPAYKDSGVPWLGDVPEHWEATTIRRYSRIFAGATPSRAVPEYWLNGSIPWLSSGDVNMRRIYQAKQFITEAGFAASSTKWIRPGSLVVALAGQGRTKGMVATVERSATCNQSLAVIEPSPKQSDYRYLAYFLESRYLDLRSLVGDGLRDGLNLEHIRSIPTPLPPLPEQHAIARFLDHIDTRINRYIRAQRKRIALLNEQKQAIIHHAVTRGLDSDVPLRPSGVEWLGDIPAHWEVVRLGRHIDLVTGFPFKSEEFTQDSQDIRLLRGINVSLGRVRWSNVVYWPIQQREAFRHYELQIGDLVLGLDRPIIQGGIRVAVISDADAPSLLLQRVARIRLKHQLSPNFLVLLLTGKSFTDYLTPIFTGISVPHLSPEQVGSFQFALPSLDEQHQIVQRLAIDVKGLEITIVKINHQIDLIREYRTRLIADVVTGKLDVREAAAGLPKELEAFEPGPDEDDAFEEEPDEEQEAIIDGD